MELDQEILARIIFYICFFILFDVLCGVIGWLVSGFSYKDHPALHKFGCRRLAMSMTFGYRLLPYRCQMNCKTDKCGNWSCPYYSNPDARNNQEDP